MLIQIAPKVKVYVNDDDLKFINIHSQTPFRASQLQPADIPRAKLLADKAIFVRKKLEDDIQYELNRHIRIVANVKK